MNRTGGSGVARQPVQGGFVRSELFEVLLRLRDGAPRRYVREVSEGMRRRVQLYEEAKARRHLDLLRSEGRGVMGASVTEEKTDRGGRDARGRFSKGNSHAFKPGRSGNPKGGDTDAHRLGAALRRLLAETDPDDPEWRTRAEVLAEAVLRKAVAGDVAAIKEVISRTEGKAPWAITLTATRRAELERKVDAVVSEAGCSREEAIKALDAFLPDVWVLLNG